jgi:iron complex transport system ATP-binding protein
MWERRVSERETVLQVETADVWVSDGTPILQQIDWTVRAGDHWALIGPNGAGKSTLLALAGATKYPSRGRVTILGETMGQTDVWALKERIGVVNPLLPQYDWFTVEDIVLTGASGTIQPQWNRYGKPEYARAHELLELLGCEELREREIASCSQGERQRVRIARALMSDPELLLLDEPATGLDLPSREALVVALSELALAQPNLATVIVSHHVEELPPTTTHALLMQAGQMIASGPVEESLTSAHISNCFGFDIRVHREEGRWAARAAASWRTRDGRRQPV